MSENTHPKPQKNVVLYTTRFCPYCMKAKRLLDHKGVTYTNIDAVKESALFKEIMNQTGWDTVPQIFIGDQFIGGCDDIHRLEEEGKLDQMLWEV